MTHRICVILELLTDDPRLDPERVDVSTSRAAGEARRAVVAALPGTVERVVAIMRVETAKLILATHEAACDAAGLSDVIQRPPWDQ
jgi:hypothetical protein